MVKAGGYAVAAKIGRTLGRWTGRRLFKGGGSSSSSFAKKRRRSSRRSVKRRKVARGHVVIDGAGGSHSSYKTAHVRSTPRIGPLQQLLAKSVYSYNTTKRLTAGASFQSADQLMQVIYGPDIAQMSGTFAASTGAFTDKFIVHTAYLESKFTNMDKGNVQITLYDIVNKRDVNASNSGNLPIGSWSAGLSNMVNAGSTSPAVTNLGVTPFNSPAFCQWYTVKKVTKITLAQGQCHTHRISIKVNRVFNRALLSNMDYLARLTHSLIVVTNGMPLNDQTTKTNISTGATVVDTVSMVRYVYQGITSNISTYAFTDGQTAPATSYLLDPGSGEPEADAAA